SKLPLIIGALVVIVAIVVVLVLVLAGDDDQQAAFDVTAAYDGLEALIDDADLSEGTQSVRNCPLGDIDDLVELIGKKVALSTEVVDGSPDHAFVDADGTTAAFVYCQTFTDDDDIDGPTGVYVEALLDAPRRYESSVEDRYGDSTIIDFEKDTRPLSGGETYLFCAEERDETGFTGCEADWVHSEADITLIVFLGGEDTSVDEAYAA
ncbi:MAG TPA: hypothetical protein PLV68_12920, partial [Ilumatobacteraceae bacterium]|nr:hypothetical protein [Ilumatobacteraceae bacterium]